MKKVLEICVYQQCRLLTVLFVCLFLWEVGSLAQKDGELLRGKD